MSTLVFHPLTQVAVSEYLSSPSHALLITGPNGIGKASLAGYVVGQILGSYENHPYVRRLQPIDNKAIPIDTVREIQHFLSLVVPGSSGGQIARAIVIENAEMLTTEAQNALLKTLEEPPQDTVLILTANSLDNVLPTIRSRVRQMNVISPATDDLRMHFAGLGYDNELIDRALLLAGELPGLAAALLTEDTDHPLLLATTHARGILQSKTYERLVLVDGLSKQKDLVTNILFILGQMSRMALMRSSAGADRWQRILAASYAATEQLRHNTQTKLVLTNLMLAL
jgi:DNA polymerase III subunit delta'